MPGKPSLTMIDAMTTDATAAGQRRLYRPHDGRMVAGVCQGLGEYFDVDPVIFRVTLAVLAFFGGIGIIAYGLAWLFIPHAGSPTTRLESWFTNQPSRRRRDAAIVVAALIALALIANGFVFRARFNGAVFVIAAVLVIVALLGKARQGERSASPATDSGYRQTATWGTSSPAWEPAATTWVTPTATRRPPSWLGWLTVGATLLVAGVLSVVGITGAAHPQPADVLAVCVGVIGLGLVVGTLVGRAWLLIPLGLLLVICLAAADALPRNLTWTAGDRTWTPVGSDVRTSYVLGAGDATLDLTQLATTTPVSIASRTGAGRITVLVPPGRAVDVHARVSAGDIELFGRDHNGTGLDTRENVAGATASAQPLSLDLQVGYGQIEVRHATS
jgi:phage shock protein PspC (stress-responsive transcriptional regulator)